jgi:MYXO-CTERM domain-containing protein
MKCRMSFVALLLLIGLTASAEAATISGTITAEATGGPLQFVEVTARCYVTATKKWEAQASDVTSASGTYSLSIPAGDYKVHARMTFGQTGNYGDRWYDVAAPDGNGYFGEDADILTLAGATNLNGINIAMEVLGGMDGRVRVGADFLPSIVVRMERSSDPRYHHNDLSEAAPNPGDFGMGGLIPANDYQLILYDPTGVHDTLVVAGPFTITSGTTGNAGDLVLSNYGADPYENNDAPNCAAGGVIAAPLHMDPPQPWASSGAYIGPASANDVDWFCMETVEGDRLILNATTEFSFGGSIRYHPWTDPVLSFWGGGGTVMLAADDDSGAGPRDATIDTGLLNAGCYCAAVSMFGDVSWNGSGQQSIGSYVMRFEMGNRPPLLEVKRGETIVPSAPTPLVMDEGETIVLSLEYPDVDHDPVALSFSHKDNDAADVVDGTLNVGLESGDYTWTASQTAAVGSPYTIRVEVADAEFTLVKDIVIVVLGVNIPAAAPELISPIGGVIETISTPTLIIANSTDPNGDSLTYDIEVYYGDPTGLPDQTSTVVEGGGGTTSWTTNAIPENTRVQWRARADDGQIGGLSPWSTFGDFLVNTINDAPETPILTRPTEGEVLMVRRPALSVNNVTDPEDDDVEFFFELATDSDFLDMVWTSQAVPMDTMGSTTTTLVDEDLAWGGEYFARAYAVDDFGGQSGYSNVHAFRIKDNVPPGRPDFVDECVTRTYTETALISVEVTNVDDTENDLVVFELEVYLIDDDPESTEPLLYTSTEQVEQATSTAIEFDASSLEDAHYSYRIRAFDGTSASEWIECDFILDLSQSPIDPEESGGCGCTTTNETGDPTGAALFFLMVVTFFWRSRRD